MARLFRKSWLLAVLALGAGCGSRQQPELLAGEEEEGADVTVQVISRNFNDVVVYLHVGASRFRLGLAGGNRTTTFVVPWRRLSNSSRVRLAADPIGNQTGCPGAMPAVREGCNQVASDDLQVTKGNRVVWALENGLGNTSLDIY